MAHLMRPVGRLMYEGSARAGRPTAARVTQAAGKLVGGNPLHRPP
jgi:hypothetical protein